MSVINKPEFAQGPLAKDSGQAQLQITNNSSPYVHHEDRRTARSKRARNLEAQRAFRRRRDRLQKAKASASRLSKKWRWTTWFQNIGAMAGFVALIVTSFYAVRMYRVAMWTARKDAVGLCSTQQVCIPSCYPRFYL